ncbi:trifunctional dihydropteroate synthetase [Savitreella phatthalungensis]
MLRAGLRLRHARGKRFVRSLSLAYLGVGSNLGDRKRTIENALNLLDDRGIRVVNTSQLYESQPMYVRDQPDFLNAVCCVMTTLPPHTLMHACQQIEKDLGRVKLVDKGPRSVDLDILSYDDESIDTPDLKIPHIGIQERDFVHIPLSDIAPELEKFGIIRANLQNHSLKLHQPHLKEGTNLMLIYNATPDSFSGGMGLETLAEFLSDVRGVDIIDVGGQSTRPGSDFLSPQEELRRVLPVIERIRALGYKGELSIDTFYADVARAACEAGATIVNDISGGKLDNNMLSTVARIGCPIVLMHMRGTPQTMMDEANTRYPDGVAQTMVAELNERYRAAIAAGVRSWNVILDPGIGFSKTAEQNLELLRTPLGGKIPWLVGPSRKGFIGTITGVTEPRLRTLGTAACITASVAQGARIVRVHERQMREVVAMADAIYNY